MPLIFCGLPPRAAHPRRKCDGAPPHQLGGYALCPLHGDRPAPRRLLGYSVLVVRISLSAVTVSLQRKAWYTFTFQFLYHSSCHFSHPSFKSVRTDGDAPGPPRLCAVQQHAHRVCDRHRQCRVLLHRQVGEEERRATESIEARLSRRCDGDAESRRCVFPGRHRCRSFRHFRTRVPSKLNDHHLRCFTAPL